ncbi:hypothetical protein [Planococcus sp. YIM B11945]|uniref:hypothetical protein n=1 Tax=Planococcus sp. YIM B11945 TaxID=3435410 RepID=UPI003D7F12DF
MTIKIKLIEMDVENWSGWQKRIATKLGELSKGEYSVPSKIIGVDRVYARQRS